MWDLPLIPLINPPLVIIGFSPPSPVYDMPGATRIFSITVNMKANVTWLINGTELSSETRVITSSYTNTSAVLGTWNVTAVASNANGTFTQEWIWMVKEARVHNLDTRENFLTIQAAIDDADTSNGNTIAVDSGTYYENVNVTKQLILRGIDIGGGKPVVNAAGIGDAMTLNADGITLDGFAAENASSSAGIRANSKNNIIRNNTLFNNGFGIHLFQSDNNTLSGNNASDNSDDGIFLQFFSRYNMLIGNNASNNRGGIVLVESNINTLSGNNVSFNEYGILLSSSDFNVLKNNHVSNNNFGISLVYYSNDNLLYNNFLNNINNFNNIYNNVINNFANTWNTSKNKTTNIISGPYLGGNFWTSPNGTGFSQTCTDDDKDGICDLPYSLFDNNIDYLPLAYHISDITPPESITNLRNITYARTNINFTWLNPSDPDFSYVMLYLNGTFLKNITAPQNFVNITGLSPDALYDLGTHTVDTSGNINQTWVNATARTAPADSTPPVADCGADRLKCENIASPVQFNASSSYDPDGSIVYYDWDFGDGTIGTGVAPKHAYSTYRWNGTAYQPFTVNLTVIDNDGLTNSTSQKVIIWIAGDGNGDGKVNILDASLVGLRWNSNPADSCADLNNDGKVNILDASIIGLNWGKSA